MNLTHFRMLFHAIIYFLYSQAFASSVQETSDENMLKLTELVFKYRQTVDPTDVVDEASKLKMNGKEKIEYFRENIKYVAKHLIYVLHEKVPKMDVVIKEMANKSKTMYDISTEKDEYENEACFYIPLLLDFVYDLTVDVEEFLNVYILYLTPCVEWPLAVALECEHVVKDGIKNMYNCSPANIYFLRTKIKLENTDTPLITNYSSLDEEFLKKATEVVKGIDKITMLSSMSLPKQRKMFEELKYDFFGLRNDMPLYQTDDKILDILNKKLHKLNDDFANKTTENIADLTEPEAVYKLLIGALKFLEINFTYKIKNFSTSLNELFPNTNDLSRDVLYSTLHGIFDNFCEYTSYIIVYLTDNYSNNKINEIIKPLGLKLAFCSPWENILNVRCPSRKDPVAELECITYTVFNRLTMNIYLITGDTPGQDNAVPDDNNTTLAMNYLQNVYKALVVYYVGKKMPIWANFSWLTGTIFVNEDLTTIGNMKLIKEQQIPILVEDNETAVSFRSCDVYKIMLPWFPNPHNVFKFYEFVTDQIGITMDNFVYRHLKTVLIYFQHVNGVVDRGVQNALSKSFLWYTESASVFIEYLHLPGNPKSRDHIEKIISAVNTLKENKDHDYDEFATLIPSEKQTELSEWFQKEFVLYNTYYVQVLTEILLENCQKANTFIQYFLSAISVTLSLKYLRLGIFGEYCVQHLGTIFKINDVVNYSFLS